MAIKENILGVTEADTSNAPSTEDYNQIDPCMLDCFPVAKYPVDLYCWHDNLAALSRVYKAEQEVSTRLRASIREMSEQGILFFSRNQIEAYTACMACDIHAAMDDPNLTWKEKSGIFIGELTRKQNDIFMHPMPQELDSLTKTLHSFCMHLIEDPRNITTVIHDVHKALTLEHRRINASLLALAIYMELHKKELYLETLETVALGFFLYDIGMTKVSPMMIARVQQLTPIEQRTMRNHPITGLEILARLNLTRPEIVEPAIQHHERLNGTGYPNKLSDDRIGHLSRIVAVADSYCAMVTEKPNRKGLAPINAAAELVTNNRQYDHSICRALVRFLQTIPSGA